jgi:hypothetical protein
VSGLPSHISRTSWGEGARRGRQDALSSIPIEAGHGLGQGGPGAVAVGVENRSVMGRSGGVNDPARPGLSQGRQLLVIGAR